MFPRLSGTDSPSHVASKTTISADVRRPVHPCSTTGRCDLRRSAVGDKAVGRASSEGTRTAATHLERKNGMKVRTAAEAPNAAMAAGSMGSSRLCRLEDLTSGALLELWALSIAAMLLFAIYGDLS